MATVKKSNGSGHNQYGSWTIVEDPNKVSAVTIPGGGKSRTATASKNNESFSGSYMGNDTAMLKALGQLSNAGQISAPSITNLPSKLPNMSPIKTTMDSLRSAEKTKTVTEVPEDKGGGNYSPAAFGFTPSATYLKAMEYTNQLLAQLSSGRTAYTDKINGLMDQIANRDAFSYDPDSDTLFQNSLQSAMSNGKVAMQDTMGQAAALTGGYGSTYATAAANQAYNGFIQDAYSNLPDYYNLALEAYNMEGQNLYNQLGMYQTADDMEYSRLANAYSANAQAAANMYDQEYNNYWQTANANESSRQWADEMALKKSQAAQSQANWQAEYELDLINAQNKADKANEVTYKEPSSAQMTKALEEYNAGGEQRLYQYLSTLSDDIDIDKIMQHIDTYGFDKQGYTIEKDTINWFGGLDKGDTFKAADGTVYKVGDMYNQLLAMGYSKEEAEKYIYSLYNNKK